MHTSARLLSSLFGGTLAALGLLWLMQWLVLADGEQLQARADHPVMEFVRLKRDSQTRLREREMPEPEPPSDETPPPPALPNVPAAKTPRLSPDIDMVVPRLSMDLSGPYLGPVNHGPADRDFMTLSRLPPRYPYRAQRRGIEGWVRVSFLITEQGDVKDPVVIAAEPENIFDQAALRAVLKWRFKPRIHHGKPIAARAEQVVQFKLDGSQ